MFFSHFSSSERPFCANNPQVLRLLIAGCLRQVALVEFRSAGISGRVAMDGAMIGGPVVTTANPGGSGIRPGRALEAINTFPRAQRESVGCIGFISITVHESVPLNVSSEMLRPLNAEPCSGHADES